MFINFAHRGASEYAPENTMASFFLGMQMGANGIETDIQKTRDGVLVLFHDMALTRVTNGTGSISDHDYEYLYALDAGSFKGEKYKNEKIVKLEDFFRYIGPKDIHFALELKVEYIEKEVMDMVNSFDLRSKVTITSFEFENLKRIREFGHTIDMGFLTTDITDEVLNKLDTIDAKQICPIAKNLTKEAVKQANNRGFNVRAWGVENMTLMNLALDCGVDGMTVNFPDKLISELERRKS